MISDDDDELGAAEPGEEDVLWLNEAVPSSAVAWLSSAVAWPSSAEAVSVELRPKLEVSSGPLLELSSRRSEELEDAASEVTLGGEVEDGEVTG